MKTRREFLKILLGGTAVLATAVTVPGMVVAAARKPETHMIKASEAVGPMQFEEIKYATSGYARTGEIHHGKIITKVNSSDSFETMQSWATVTISPEEKADWITFKS